VELTGARYTMDNGIYILHSDQSLQSSRNPCQRTRPTKGCEVRRDVDVAACPLHANVDAAGWIFFLLGGAMTMTTAVFFSGRRTSI